MVIERIFESYFAPIRNEKVYFQKPVAGLFKTCTSSSWNFRGNFDDKEM